MSLFSTWRFWNKHIEVSAGVVDIQGLFTGSDGNSGFSLTADSSFVKPGIWMGIRFSGNIGFGKNEGMQGLETRITRQQETINLLEQELDTVKEMLNISSKKYAAMNRNQSGSSDGQMDEANRLKNLIFDKLVSLKTLYSQEPYEPEQVKTALREVASYQNRALSPLGDIALDKAQDRQIRLIAVSILGELRSSGASDILLSALSKTEDPDMKIETLIALGKTKETRAGYLIRQLTNDPNDAVAFTASEVLQKLEKETGVNFGTKGSANEAVQPYMKEKKIGTDGVSPLREKSKGEKKPTIEKVIPDSAASNAGAAFTETTLLPDSVSGPQNDSTIVKVDSTALKTGVSAPAQKDTSAGPVTTAPSPAQKSAPTKKAAPVKKKRAVEKEDGTW